MTIDTEQQAHQQIEREDAQHAFGLILEAQTLEEAQSIAASFLEGAQ